jgi:hypothetical protein
MLVASGVPFEEVEGIQAGDFIYETEILSVYKTAQYIKVKTASGEIYTLHRKAAGYNVFKFTEGRHFTREAKRKEKKIKRAERRKNWNSLKPPPS